MLQIVVQTGKLPENTAFHWKMEGRDGTERQGMA
jgi:hypothetical protein